MLGSREHSPILEKVTAGFKTKINVINDTPSKHLQNLIEENMQHMTEPHSTYEKGDAPTFEQASAMDEKVSQRTLNFEDGSATRRTSVLKKQHG